MSKETKDSIAVRQHMEAVANAASVISTLKSIKL